MRAVVVRSFGGPEVLEVVEVATPEAGPGEVRVRVEAAAVNPVDLATRSGILAKAGLLTGDELPLGIGWDVAGVVDQAGEGVTEFAVGDRVIGLSDRVQLPLKTQAEYVVLAADAVAPAPGTDMVAASTLPLNASTALQALDLLALEPGRTLLVTGAAGGVGGFAVEQAAARGLRVVASAGEGDEDLVRGLGAELFVPRTAPLSESVRSVVPGGVDAVLDAAVVGVQALDAVRNSGKFIAVVAGGNPPPLRGIDVRIVWVRADSTTLRGVVRLVEQGKLTPRVAETLPLADVAEAHRRFEKGGVRGRLVLVP